MPRNSQNVKKIELVIFKHKRKKLDSSIKIKLSRRLYPGTILTKVRNKLNRPKMI